MPVVPDPSGPCPSSGALAWASSPRDGKPSLTLVAVCLLLVCVELQRGFTSRETCVVSAAPSGTVVISSSSRGQESVSSVAEGRFRSECNVYHPSLFPPTSLKGKMNFFENRVSD